MSDSPHMTLIAAAALIGLSVAVTTIGGCDIKHDEVVRVLSQQGYTDIQSHGYAWFSCGKGDSFSQKFSAKKQGFRVTGTICGGWFKNYTVRYD